MADVLATMSTRGRREGDDEHDGGGAPPAGASHGWAGPSRSQQKRDARAVSDVGAELVRLSAAALARLPLDDELREAVEACRGMQRAALARQLRFVGKLLRARDHAAIAQAVAELGQPSGAEILREKQAEAWRERLLAGGEAALVALVTALPAADPQLVRQLVRQGDPARTGATAQRARRELFRHLRALLAAAGG